MAVWGILALIASAATSSWSRKVVAWTGAALVVALVGATRVYLGAHWPSDVLGGWAAGALWLFVVASADQALRPRGGSGDRPPARTAPGDTLAGAPADRQSLQRPGP